MRRLTGWCVGALALNCILTGCSQTDGQAPWVGSATEPQEPGAQTAAAVPERQVLGTLAEGPTGVDAGPLVPEIPRALGSEHHLFVDAFLIETIRNASLVANPPLPKELVIVADQPWERNGLPAYGNVLHDPVAKEDRFYYTAINLDAPQTWTLCLATSTDGIHWTKPDLRAVEWGGSTENNIVMYGGGGAMMLDPNAPAERRYVYFSSGFHYTSPDGIHFAKQPEKLTPLYSDSQISSFWDDESHQYVFFPRKYLGGLTPRAVGRAVSATVNGDWGVKIFGDDQQDTDMPTVMARDALDPEGMDLYTNAAHKYARAKGTYLAFPTPYYHYDDPRRAYLAEGLTNDATIETQLATSRDSIQWTRYRTPYVPNYTHDGLALKVCMIYPGMLYRTDRIDQYFAGYTFRHGDREKRRELGGRELGGIFRAEQRLDGFAAIEFAGAGGEVVTKPLTFTGNQLRLNVNTSTAGEGRVAVLDAQGMEIAPFTLDNCQIVHGDHLDRTVIWFGAGADLSSLTGRPVRLKLAFRRSKVFAFQFVEDTLPAAPPAKPPEVTSFEGTGALWLFDEPADSSVGTTLQDSSGNGFHLTLGANGALVPGMVGNALRVGDAYTYAAIRHSIAETVLNLHDADWTFECFVRITAPRSAYHKLFVEREGPAGRGNATGVDLQAGQHNLRFMNLSGGYWVNLRTAAEFWDSPTEDWHHVAITFKADEHQLRHFIGGALQLPLPPPGPMGAMALTGTDYLSIGCDANGDNPFNGLIDEVRMTNRCLYLDDFTSPERLSDPGDG